MATIASRSPPEPDWIELRISLNAYYLDRSSVGVKDAAFAHVYQAIRYLARHVVARNLHSSQGSITDISETIVDKVFKKSFTDIAEKYDPENTARFKTWATTVLLNAFINWCRSQNRGLQFIPIGPQDVDEVESEWKDAVRDIVDCDMDGERRIGVVTQLIGKEDALTQAEKKAAVLRAIDALPEKLRRAILADEGKETQKQVAERLRVSLPTYKRHRQLALAKLKERLT